MTRNHLRECGVLGVHLHNQRRTASANTTNHTTKIAGQSNKNCCSQEKKGEGRRERKVREWNGNAHHLFAQAAREILSAR